MDNLKTIREKLNSIKSVLGELDLLIMNTDVAYMKADLKETRKTISKMVEEVTPQTKNTPSDFDLKKLMTKIENEVSAKFKEGPNEGEKQCRIFRDFFNRTHAPVEKIPKLTKLIGDAKKTEYFDTRLLLSNNYTGYLIVFDDKYPSIETFVIDVVDILNSKYKSNTWKMHGLLNNVIIGSPEFLTMEQLEELEDSITSKNNGPSSELYCFMSTTMSFGFSWNCEYGITGKAAKFDRKLWRKELEISKNNINLQIENTEIPECKYENPEEDQKKNQYDLMYEIKNYSKTSVELRSICIVHANKTKSEDYGKCQNDCEYLSKICGEKVLCIRLERDISATSFIECIKNKFSIDVVSGDTKRILEFKNSDDTNKLSNDNFRELYKEFGIIMVGNKDNGLYVYGF